MIQIAKSDSQIKIVADSIAEVVEVASWRLDRDVCAIATGYVDPAGAEFLSNFEQFPTVWFNEPEFFEGKLVKRLEREIVCAESTPTRMILVLKLHQPLSDSQRESLAKGLPTVVPSMHSSAEDQATAKAIADIAKGLPTVVPNL